MQNSTPALCVYRQYGQQHRAAESVRFVQAEHSTPVKTKVKTVLQKSVL